MPLFETERHEPLTETTWDVARARSTIERIFADTERAFSENGFWPIHPFDRSSERPPDSMKPLYFGAAGVIWALTYLAECGAARGSIDFLPSARMLRTRHRQDIDQYEGVRSYLGPAINSFMMGETGMLLLEWKLAPSERLATAIYKNIEATAGDPRGLVWGSAGSMLAALSMHWRTGEWRWGELYRRLFNSLWPSLQYEASVCCMLWTSNLYGVKERRLGALHGYAANMGAILRGADLLDEGQRADVSRTMEETLRATALHDDDYVNWPSGADSQRRPFVQYCNGAPGFISALSLNGVRSDGTTALFKMAGELIWAAGPLVKLPVLCHGTPGNGFAFLKLYAHTGEEIWLARARAFAMHAIAQNERALGQYGQRKFSLWTGDLGLAVYLWNCIQATASFPILDIF